MSDPSEVAVPLADPPVPAAVVSVLTTAIGSIAAFQPESERIESYLERVELYMTANNFPEGRKMAALLSIVGGTAYEILRSLLAPALPQTKSYTVLVETLQKHYAPKPLVIAERFHFHRRDQKSGESIAKYIAELRKLSIHCEFGDYLNQALHDRLVCGLRSEAPQKRLLAESDLTLAKAMSLAQGMEAASLNAQSLKGQDNPIHRTSMHGRQSYVKGPPSDGDGNKLCYRCGRSNHTPADCRFRDAECHNCGKKGHIAPACRGKSKKPSQPSGQPSKGG